MSSETPPAPLSSDRRGVKRMLLVFAILGVLGVFALAISVIVGLIVLVAAEAFFFVAYRRFVRSSRSAR